MDATQGSATAYDKLSTLTEAYNEIQARLQDIRVLTRALRTLAPIYVPPDQEPGDMGLCLTKMMQAATIERNRLYQQAVRLTGQMDSLNARIQNGVYNEDKA